MNRFTKPALLVAMIAASGAAYLGDVLAQQPPAKAPKAASSAVPLASSAKASPSAAPAVSAAAPPPAASALAFVPAGPDAKAEFLQVYKVLLSPRCKNCHPAGDAPLQGEQSKPHSMNVSRKSVAAGLGCTTCHRLANAPGEGAPPGVEGWRMPSSSIPMVFEGKTPAELCAQLKDPAQTNGRSLESLIEHVDHDALVLWGWAPGGSRAKPPMTHDELVKHMRAWVAGGAACPL